MLLNIASMLAAASLVVAHPAVNNHHHHHHPTTRASAFGNSSTQGGMQNAAYFTNWGIYGRNYQANQLPVNDLNIVLYAFAQFDSSGTVSSSDTFADVEKHFSNDSWSEPGNNAYGCVKQLFELKTKNRQLKVLLSIGGWTYSLDGKFAAAVETADKRSTFVKSAFKLVTDWGFDGIDIDWEYPTDSTEADNFVALLQEFRKEMDSYSATYANNYHFLLTVASPAGPAKYSVQKLGEMNEYLDFFFFMGYDYAGAGFSNFTGHQANLYPDPANENATPFSTDKAITDYVAAGVTPSKIVLGMPIYGRTFAGTAGIGQSFTSDGGAGSWENGIWDYKVLPKSGATEQTDSVAGASYSYDSSSQELITYDTPSMVKTKIDYVKSKGLGGGMFWEASADKTGADSLIGTSATALGSLDLSENLLDYPESVYDNIRTRLGYANGTQPTS